MVKSGACQELESKVIKTGLCTLCGACVGNCPYLTAYEGKVLLRDVCDLPTGHCQAACPRLSLDLDGMSKAFFKTPYSGDGLGSALKVIMARTTDSAIKTKAQDAGAVTALICFALEEGLIDSAILTRFEDKSWPRGIIASTSEEVLNCSGSSYSAAPTIESFNRALSDADRRSIGVVATPCQAMSLAKMKMAPPEIFKGIDKLQFVVGLFCTWALSYPDFSHFLQGRVSAPIKKYDIPPHPADALFAYTEKERIFFPIEEVLPFVRPACRFCLDLTAEFADISVGGGRGEVLNWNTIVIRTERGMKLIDSAVMKGILETAPIPEGNLDRLKKAAQNKRKRAIGKIIEKTGCADDLLYLKAEPGMIKRLVEE